jgi:hypothetical protein
MELFISRLLKEPSMYISHLTTASQLIEKVCVTLKKEEGKAWISKAKDRGIRLVRASTRLLKEKELTSVIINGDYVSLCVERKGTIFNDQKKITESFSFKMEEDQKEEWVRLERSVSYRIQSERNKAYQKRLKEEKKKKAS